MNLRDRINEYPNFPKKGILFRDFSPILKDYSAMSLIIEEFSKFFHPNSVDIFAGIESRGFPIAFGRIGGQNVGAKLSKKTENELKALDYDIDEVINTLQKNLIQGNLNLPEGLKKRIFC